MKKSNNKNTVYFNRNENEKFLRSAFEWRESVSPKVMRRVFTAAIYSLLITIIFSNFHDFQLALGPFEISGAIIGILLVFRVNSGYERWWEARKLWGGIVNQCRNLAIKGLQYGPNDYRWKKSFICWIIAFAHSCKKSLRGQKELPELNGILSEGEISLILDSNHYPSFTVSQLSSLLAKARSDKGMDSFCFLQMDKELSSLLDYTGGCERILKTPIPLIMAIKIRRFIFLFLLMVPFVLITKVGWYTPLLMFVISYPIFSVDQIGLELQNPFSEKNLSHLPLNDITKTIETNLLSYLNEVKQFPDFIPPNLQDSLNTTI